MKKVVRLAAVLVFIAMLLRHILDTIQMKKITKPYY